MCAMRIMSFIDLDGTFIQSLKDAREGEEHFPGYVNENGEVIGYISRKQQKLADLLFSTKEVVPVTGRTSESLDRVLLHFQWDGWKVVCHGALVVRWDKIDRYWLREFNEPIMRLQHDLPFIFEHVERFVQEIGAKVRCQLKKDHGFMTHISIKAESEEEIEDFFWNFFSWRKQGQGMEHLPTDYAAHLNGRELTIRLASLNKRNAVQWIIDRETEDFGGLVTLGFGDDFSDLPFLDLCDFACFPKSSEISRELQRFMGEERGE